MAQIERDSTLLTDDVGIWRYMDVGSFLYLIREKKLYLTRLRELHQLGDSWEGVWTDPWARQIRDSGHDQFINKKVRRYNSDVLISCWHENERESVAMWKLYVSGNEGVAIKTMVGRLRNALESMEPVIERVRYKPNEYTPQLADFEGIPAGDLFLFRKTPGYTHEQEVRAVMHCYPASAAFDSLASDSDWPDWKGQPVPIDLSALIERIVVSPEFHDWALPSLQRVVDTANIHTQIEKSSLLVKPTPDFMGVPPGR